MPKVLSYYDWIKNNIIFVQTCQRLSILVWLYFLENNSHHFYLESLALYKVKIISMKMWLKHFKKLKMSFSYMAF